MTSEPRRGSLLSQIASWLGGRYNPTGPGSSVGRVEVGGFAVFCKPETKYPDHAENERILVESVNSAVAETGGPIRIEAVDSRSRRLVFSGICHAFRLPSNYRRMDVALVKEDGSLVKVSAKMTNFSFWCSAWPELVKKISPHVPAIETEGRSRIGRRGEVTSVWMPLSSEEKHYALFGDEASNESAVIIGNFFIPKTIERVGSVLRIFPESMIRSVQDIDSWITPIAVARNESRSVGALPGIRFEIQAARKITAGYRMITSS